MNLVKAYALNFLRNRLNIARATLVAGCLALSGVPMRAADLAPATSALLDGNADAAVSQLKQIVAAEPDDGQAHLLLCRAYYAQWMAAAAAAECTAALRTLANDSVAQDWAGRAYGMQADSAGPIAGLRLAFKVRNAFEAAVRLNPLNGDAINDLSEYYIDAPSIVGGGFDKAATLADRSAAQLPQNAHRTRAMSAEKQKDYATAEREFRAAAAVGNRPNAWADLGAFYSRRSQYDRAVDALRHTIALDRAHDASLVDAATVLTEMNREPRLAERALRDYLGSHAKTDSAPAFRVHVMLAKLLRNQGNSAEAKIEVEQSLSLASAYAPARKELAAIQHEEAIATR